LVGYEYAGACLGVEVMVRSRRRRETKPQQQ